MLMPRVYLSAVLTLTALSLSGSFSHPFASEHVTFDQSRDSSSIVAISDEGDDGFTLHFSLGKLRFKRVMTDRGPFTLLSIDGMSGSHEVGEPCLPVLSRLVSIPPGCDFDATVIGSESEDLSLNSLGISDPIAPCQPSICKSCNADSVPFEYDSLTYAQRGFFSLPLANTRAVGNLRSLSLGVVTISPIQYSPVGHKLRLFRRVTIRVEFSDSDRKQTRDLLGAYSSPFFEPICDLVLNAKPCALFRDSLTRYPVKYVIISDRMFENQLQPFVEWKIIKGFDVVLAFTDIIGGTAAQIKGFIGDLYNNATPEDPAPSFVLLVGDTPQIPSYHINNHTSDLPYCEFTGDMFPDIYYGRFSANTQMQLQPQIDKTLEYEEYSLPDSSYLVNAVLVAGVDELSADPWLNGQINYALTHYFNPSHGIAAFSWLYPESAEPGVSDEMAQIIGDGTCVVNYTGHCGHTGFTDPSFQIEDIMEMSNTYKYGLAIGNCCLSNTFDEATACFGEEWLRAVGAGGVGYIGASDGTHWNEDYWWAVGSGPIVGSGADYEETGQGAYDGMFHDHEQDIDQHYVTNASIIFAGNLAVTEASSPELAQYYWEIYHLMGDPSVMTYLGIPTVNNVSHPQYLLTTTTVFNILAEPGSYVGITRDGVLHGAGHIGTAGQTYVTVEPFSEPGEAYLVVTCQNRIPYSSVIQIHSPDMPYLSLDSCEIDDSSGNGNSQADLGESISLTVHLRNEGLFTADNVIGTLSSQDPGVTVIDSTASFGSIDGEGGTGYSSPAYRFVVAGNVPDEHIARFDLSISADSGYAWELHFNTMLHSPVLRILSTALNDSMGNCNGVIDPGETGSICLTLENTGSAAADSVTGVLFSPDPLIVVSHSTCLFGQIPAGGEQIQNPDSAYVISADSALSAGDSVELRVSVTAPSGYSDTLHFQLRIGNLPPSLLPIGPQSVQEGDSLYLTIHATDPDGDAPGLSAENLPLNASFSDGGQGTGIFSFFPDLTQEGVYQVVFVAYDGIDADTENVEITVTNLSSCGDADGSGAVDIDDIVFIINYIFDGGPEPEPFYAGDTDCSGTVDIDDAVGLIAYVFSEGNEPCDVDGDEVPDC